MKSCAVNCTVGVICHSSSECSGRSLDVPRYADVAVILWSNLHPAHQHHSRQ